jgi:subtilase family serine protease
VVTLLKKWGFKVISESARDIHISGPLHLFESVFSTTLAESPPYWKWRKSPSIPKEFADEVANVILPEAVDHCHE